jgi:hypothetical protein
MQGNSADSMRETLRREIGPKIKKGQDRHPARFNPISYEKPTHQTTDVRRRLHRGKKKAPIDIRAVSIQYSMKINSVLSKFFAKVYHSD